MPDHPQRTGFTPRYVWMGRERVIIWMHCGEDARQGSTRHAEGGRIDAHDHVICDACGLRYDSECLWRMVGAR